jgi:hypothetical protein
MLMITPRDGMTPENISPSPPTTAWQTTVAPMRNKLPGLRGKREPKLGS